MDLFEDFFAKSKIMPENKAKLAEILNWAQAKYPQLNQKIGWNQPMLTDHGTFIISFAPFKKHFSVAPEVAAIKHFSKEIEKAGYTITEGTFRILWEQPVNYGLLAELIEYNLIEKKDYDSFWRKAPNRK